MIEVFRTNVDDPESALRILERIAIAFPDYKSNFDLGDCDRILRVEAIHDPVRVEFIYEMFRSFGFWCEILPDDDGELLFIFDEGNVLTGHE